jgi:hypothetical protein
VATNAENIATRIAAIYAQLAAMSSTSPGGKPTYSIDGQMVDHVGYRKSLLEELKMLNELQAAAAGPFEVVDQYDA